MYCEDCFRPQMLSQHDVNMSNSDKEKCGLRPISIHNRFFMVPGKSFWTPGLHLGFPGATWGDLWENQRLHVARTLLLTTFLNGHFAKNPLPTICYRAQRSKKQNPRGSDINVLDSETVLKVQYCLVLFDIFMSCWESIWGRTRSYNRTFFQKNE